jgi:hypothetical protein
MYLALESVAARARLVEHLETLHQPRPMPFEVVYDLAGRTNGARKSD